MAQVRRKIVLVKAEGTYGSDPTHAVTDAQLLHDFQLTRVAEPEIRQVDGYLMGKSRADVLGGRMYRATFWQEMRGNSQNLTALVKPLFHDLLQACGWAGTFNAGTGSWTYVQTYGESLSVAMECNYDGCQYLLLGGRGSARFSYQAKKRARIFYDMMFLHADSSAVSFPALADTDIADVAPLICQSLGFQPSIYSGIPTASQYGHMNSIEIDCATATEAGDSVDLPADGVGRFLQFGSGDENDPGPRISLQVEQPSGVAAANAWEAAYDGQTVMTSATISLGSSAGNALVHTVSRWHVSSPPRRVAMGRRAGYQIEGRLLLSAGATTEDSQVITAT